MITMLVGTGEGLLVVDGAGVRTVLSGPAVDAVAGGGGVWWALHDGSILASSDDPAGSWVDRAKADGDRLTCLAADASGRVLVGTAGAHLLQLGTDDALERVVSFDRADGRDAWYTPWGAPPDTRSLTVTEAGTILANIHVGGILRSTDGASSWSPTLDIDHDVHEVRASGGGRVVAAAAVGLVESDDDGASWRVDDRGMHASYSRAVAAGSDMVFVSASTGPDGRRSAIYRRSLSGPGPLERCVAGLPEWLDGNIDSGRLDAAGDVVAFGTRGGTIYVSEDAGESWAVSAEGLAPITTVRFAGVRGAGAP
jgi:hypothetical protein